MGSELYLTDTATGNPSTQSTTSIDKVYTKFQVNSITHEPRNLNIKKTMHDSNASSTFKAVFDSPFGKYKSSFTVGHEVLVYADETDATTKIFSGVLEKIQFKGKGATQTVTLSGRDYSLRLQDITAQPQVFNDTEVSEIITGLLSNNNVPDITINNVNVTSTTLNRMTYNHESIFDAFTELAKVSNFIFYVDEDKDLHFVERKSVDSGVTIGDSQNNLLESDLNRSREGMGNIVWVYGDRYLSGFQERINTGSPAGGSDYTLLSRPHNVEIFYLGSTLKGSIKDITLTLTSGPDYQVDFFDRKIIFLSGADIGYSSIPASGGSVIVNYQRELPIVKYAENPKSINFYGPKVKIIKDKSIKDPNIALDLLKTTLNDSNPLNRLKCKLKGWFTFNPGEKVVYDLDDFNISQIEMSIIEINYQFDKNSVQNNSTITLILSKKLLDITDQIKEMNKRLTAIESQEVSDTDILTRLLSSEESMTIVGSNWNVYTRTLGSSFVLGKGYHGVTGPTFGGILGSTVASGINFLGDSRSALSLQYSGGNDYSVTGSYNDAGSEGPPAGGGGGYGTYSAQWG